jgi:hypothetical protein
VKLTVPASLSDTLPAEEAPGKRSRRSVSLTPGSWQKIAQELHERFPLLAERVLTESLSVARGFVLVVNGTVMRGDYMSLDFGNDDELFILPAMAGG